MFPYPSRRTGPVTCRAGRRGQPQGLCPYSGLALPPPAYSAGYCYPLQDIAPLAVTAQAGDRTITARFCTIRRGYSGADLSIRGMIQRVSVQLPAVYHAFHRATWLHVLVILAAGAALRWPLLTLAPFFTTDSRCCYYHYATNQLLAGQPFDSGLHFPPGYSLFLAAILAVTDGSTAAAILVQHFIGLASGLLVYLIGRRLFGSLVGLAAALLTVLDVELALYEHAVLSEPLFTVLLLCGLALVLLRWPGSIWLKVAGFGLLAGAATLVRPTGLLLPCLVLLLPRLGPASSAAGGISRNAWYRRLWRASQRVRLTLVAIVGAALIVVPMMVWNQRTHGVFALTTSLQRNMLYRIEEAPERLLRGRGGGDPLLGQSKATISHHPTPPWTGPYGRLLERFHLSNEELDRLLMRVALDFVLADPLAYIGDTMRRLPPLLTGSHATASDRVQGGRREYITAGGSDKLGVSAYDYATDQAVAQAFDQRTEFLHYSRYAWPLLALAVLGTVFRPSRALVPAAALLYVVLVSVGTNNPVVRFRYPVTWVLYLLAAGGLVGLIAALDTARSPRSGWWIRLWPGVNWRAMLRRDQNPLSIAVPVTAVIVAGLMLVAKTTPYRIPVTMTITTDPISVPSAQLDRLDWHLPADPPQPRLVALSLPDQLAFDLIGPDGLVPDGQADASLLLSVGNDVWDVQSHVLKFVELGSTSGPIWDTTGWYQPLLIIRIDDGEYLSQHTDPRSKSLKLQIGDRLLVLAYAQRQPVTPEHFGVLRLHLDSGTVLSYPVEAAPLVVPRRDTAPAPQDWLAQHAAASDRVAIVQREVVRVVVAESAFSAAPWRIALTSGDRAAIRKWLHAETLARHDIRYVWVGNSAALKGEAATAVLDPTRLRPVLLQVQPGECPVRWRGLFVVATAAAATDAPLVPLTIPHPLAADEFQGMIRFGAGVSRPLAPGNAATMSLDVTNGSTQVWYGTCSSPTYPVGVAVEARRSPAAPWTLIGEALLTDDLPAGATTQVNVAITAPREAGRYELRARLIQRPDRVSPAVPALASLVVKAGNGG